MGHGTSPSLDEHPLHVSVAVLKDRRYARKCHWDAEFFAKVEHRGSIKVRSLDVFTLSDDSRDDEPHLLAELHKYQVLIVNWDAANGDPDFGSDYVLGWFAHRRPEILRWVRSGNVLIIEGQCYLSAVAQRAYDALLGPREVRVSGRTERTEVGEQPADVEAQRVGQECRLVGKATRWFMAKQTLRYAGERSISYTDLFPAETAGKILTNELKDQAWDMLYRGWFRRDTLGRRFYWHRLVETSTHWPNFPTLLGARHHNGTIFASTMFLASHGQVDLVVAMLNCAGRKSPPSMHPLRRLLLSWERRMQDFFVEGGKEVVELATSFGIFWFVLSQLPRLTTGDLHDLVSYVAGDEPLKALLAGTSALLTVPVYARLRDWYGRCVGA